MDKQQLFNNLHYAFTGKGMAIDRTLAEYENLPPEEAYTKAKDNLEGSRRGQDNCQSDWAYWGWEGDITKAIVIMNVFDAIRKGATEFPELPNTGGECLMDKCQTLQGWSSTLIK